MESMTKSEICGVLKEYGLAIADKSRVEMENKEMNELVSKITEVVIQSDDMKMEALYAVLNLSSMFNKFFIKLAIDKEELNKRLKIMTIVALILTLLHILTVANIYANTICYFILLWLYFAANMIIDRSTKNEVYFYGIWMNIEVVQSSNLRRKSFIECIEHELFELYDAGDLNNERFKYLLGLRLVYAALDFSSSGFRELWPPKDDYEKHKDKYDL